ncbi:MAG: DUF6922 domain-containing protein [Thermodesulfobacteriota bacterium]
MIPDGIGRLFWDVDKNALDLKRHRSYIIKRIMDYGDIEEVKWMLKTYSSEEVIEVVKKSRGLSRKSAYFWAAYFDIPREEIACLKMSSPKGPRPF